jgi:protoporphyrinogen oxidase
MPRVGIIGAGPAGLTAAYLLTRAKIPVVVWEANPRYVGGISRTEVYRGYRFDIGGHRFFSKSQEVEDLWTEILPYDLLTCQRLSRIYYKGKFYSYPLDILEVLTNIGGRQTLLTLASYLKARLTPNREAEDLETWLTQRFGGRLYHMFFKSYTEKVWGKACTELSADWAMQRIQNLSLGRAVRNALLAPPAPESSLEPELEQARKKVIKSLITQFRYPRLGPGMFWEAAAEKMQAGGGSLQMGTAVKELKRLPSGHWQVRLEQAGESRLEVVDQLISSAPLGWLVNTIQPELPSAVRDAGQGLSYRDFLTVALILRPSKHFPDNWLYIHDPNLLVGRIQNFANWSAEMVPDPSQACYGMEYFCDRNSDFWNLEDQQLVSFATQELEKLQLINPGEVIDGTVVRQAKAYPVYDDTYEKRRMIIKEGLGRHCPGLHVVGRNGMHQYNNQDHSMMTAMLTVRNILAGKQIYDPWQVNQDAEYIESAGKSSGYPVAL